MKFKTEFNLHKDLRFSDLKPGQLFRCKSEGVPLMRLSDGYAEQGRGLYVVEPRVEQDARVVRIRIDRVEDGVPVFVDA